MTSSPNTRCDVNDFYSVLMELCRETVEEDQEALETNVEAAGRQAAEELRKVRWKQSRGKYNNGWRSDYRVGPSGHAKAVVHNTSQPSLTHLLENGHELFYMGRDTGRRVPAYKHIEPAYENARHIVEGGE